MTRPGKELYFGPHQFGDDSMWHVQLKPFQINNRTALTLSTISPVSCPMWLHGCFLTMEYSMPHWVEIILESNEEIALLTLHSITWQKEQPISLRPTSKLW
ncbi:hypothetical protein GYMLUDRAFT_62685 [Collybiopsis luxurians FD-317 M1]|uniref:Uncharacterized protein n=1 Tax=Collybiopsis luxurians FD-317 M1 TaxID=944289 RepID=A0A0D0BKJ0_9AGAR|nr:hypothetical protein GYMLUDRAFT_62685 [Collybiopsis luxurians FD-317 M1]